MEEIQFARCMQEWIKEACNGSPHALGQALQSRRPHLLLIAHQLIDPDLRPKAGASDLVQETFLYAQRNFGRFLGSTEEELLAWFRRILLNNAGHLARHFRCTDKRQPQREFAPADALLDELINAVMDVGGSPSRLAIVREEEQGVAERPRPAARPRLPSAPLAQASLVRKNGRSLVQGFVAASACGLAEKVAQESRRTGQLGVAAPAIAGGFDRKERQATFWGPSKSPQWPMLSQTLGVCARGSDVFMVT
jgi:DNA-directed RNA polymerase specialized sigma24 family protein